MKNLDFEEITTEINKSSVILLVQKDKDCVYWDTDDYVDITLIKALQDSVVNFARECGHDLTPKKPEPTAWQRFKKWLGWAK